MKVLNRFEEYLGGALFIAIFIVLCAQIITRFHAPLIWSDELAKLLFVYMGTLGISLAIFKQEHVYIDFFTNLLDARIARLTNSFVQIIIFCGVLFMVHFGVRNFNNATFHIDALWGISEKWLFGSLLLISFLMLLRFLQAQAINFKNRISFIPSSIFVILSIAFLIILFTNPDLFNYLRIYKYIDLKSQAIYISLLVWLFIMFLGVPVGWSLFISTILYFALTRWGVANAAAPKLTYSLDSFPFLAVPFYILTGILMNTGGITTRIFDFARALLGHFTGGMGHVNIGASLLFSGMSGSALADAGGLGKLEIKAMRDAGYDDDICGGITAASCIIGPLVPPSIAMIIYGVIANVSIAKLFIAGFIPGVLVTIALMAMNYRIAKIRNYPKTPKSSKRELWNSFKGAFWAILTPILIIGGIFSGLFSPTESAVVATLYSIIIGKFIYKELSFKKIFDSCIEAMGITGVISLMIICVTFFGDMIAREQVAIHVADAFVAIADSKLSVLIMINALLLFLGMFIDALALQFLVLPMLIPIAVHFGIDLIFFGVMTTLNMMIGILTPPMGMALFVVSKVGGMSVSTVTKGVLPFLIPIFVTLGVITVFPQIITFIPNLMLGS